MKKWRILWTMMVVAMVVVMAGQPALAKKVIKWKAQSAWPSGLLGQKAFEDFCQKVKAMSGGRLIIKPYPVGAIVPYSELLEAVENNILQAMYGWPGYWAGKDPAFSIMSDLTAAWNTPQEAYAFHYYQGGLEMLNKLYEPFGVHCVGVVIVGMESLTSKVPLRGIADFKGIKIRSPEGMLGDLLRKMGASVVVLPSDEAYSALDKGVVDATDYSSPTANYRLGLHQVAKYFNFPGFHSLPQSDFTVNKRAWNKLPDDLKEIVRIAQREWCQDFIQRGFIEDLEAVEKMKAAGCVQVKWSDEELTKVRKLAEQVWDEWAKKSPRCKEGVELQKKWLRRLGNL
jgi:TRAP-type mannitol/chloroaromatic compound transport system substrate-binding protein